MNRDILQPMIPKSYKAFQGNPDAKARWVYRVSSEGTRKHEDAKRQRVAFKTGDEPKNYSLGDIVQRYADEVLTFKIISPKGNTESIYFDQLGIPPVLGLLQQRIWEELSVAEANRWAERFIRAIPVGADLGPVWPKFAHWLLTDDQIGVLSSLFYDENAHFENLVEFFREWSSGRAVTEDEWMRRIDSIQMFMLNFGSEGLIYRVAKVALSICTANMHHCLDSQVVELPQFGVRLAAEMSGQSRGEEITASQAVQNQATHINRQSRKLLELIEECRAAETGPSANTDPADSAPE